MIVGVEGGCGYLEARAKAEAEAVAGGVAEVDLADHEAGRDEGLSLPVVRALVVAVRVSLNCWAR